MFLEFLSQFGPLLGRGKERERGRMKVGEQKQESGGKLKGGTLKGERERVRCEVKAGRGENGGGRKWKSWRTEERQRKDSFTSYSGESLITDQRHLIVT